MDFVFAPLRRWTAHVRSCPELACGEPAEPVEGLRVRSSHTPRLGEYAEPPSLRREGKFPLALKFANAIMDTSNSLKGLKIY